MSLSYGMQRRTEQMSNYDGIGILYISLYSPQTILRA